MNASRPPHGLAGVSAAAGRTVGFGALVGTAAAHGPSDVWGCELASSLGFHWAVAATVAVVLLAVGRRWLLCATAALVAAIGLLPVVAYRIHDPRSSPAADATTAAPVAFRMVSVNVRASNDDTTRLSAWLTQQAPDVVVVVEVSPVWAAALEGPAFAQWPHRVIEEGGVDGIAVLSREPLRDAEVVLPGALGPPIIDARTSVGGCGLRVVGLHAWPPASPALHGGRDALIGRVAARLGQHADAVVAGDWNAPLQARVLRGFADATGLVDAARGRWRRTTWMPWLGVLGLDLDRVFAPASWSVESLDVGPVIGSDHVPVRVDFRVPRSSCAAAQ